MGGPGSGRRKGGGGSTLYNKRPKLPPIFRKESSEPEKGHDPIWPYGKPRAKIKSKYK